MAQRHSEARSHPVLTAGYASLALQLQEAATQISNGDVVRRLSDCLHDCFRGSGHWAYYIDHFGDDSSGDVIYNCDGETYRAGYAMSSVNGKAACTIDTDNASDVVPRTVWEEEAEDEDHMLSMESQALYRKGEIPLYERFISKDERDSADRSSFAGKGKSFPILKPSDVMAAVRAIGRAGADNYDAGTLKRNIIKIAKAKGWEKELPKAWRGGDKAEESAPGTQGSIKLIESCAFPQDIELREAFTPNKRIKLITPGKGSKAFYTEEVLKRDGPAVFKAGTPMRIDHPTAAQEAERPEGSVKDWGAVLAKDAVWMDDGPAGKGLYSEVKPFSDHANLINEKGPYAGVSICAYGDVLIENGKPVMREGVPVLARLTQAEGVDMVTRAGAGGLFLSEAAKPATNEGGADDMDAAELKRLQESYAQVESTNKKLLERAIRGDAERCARKALEGVTLHESAKALIVDSVMARELPLKEGELDAAKFTESVNAEAKRVGEAIAASTGAGRVIGMGAAAPVQVTAEEAARQKDQKAQRLKESIQAFVNIGMPEEAAKRAAMRNEEAA